MAAQDFTSRSSAKAAGATRYFTGLPCKHGHLSARLTINGSCCECSIIRQKVNYDKDPERYLARQRARVMADPLRNEKKRARIHRAKPDLEIKVKARDAEFALRNEASAKGETTYISSRQCKHDQSFARFLKDGKCVECNRINCHKRFLKTNGLTHEELEARKSAKVAARVQKAERKKETITKKAKAATGRSIAQERGDLTYVGSSCPRGHDGTRYTSSGTCLACGMENVRSPEKKTYDKTRFSKFRDIFKAQARQRYIENREERLLASKLWFQRNPEKANAIKQNYKHRRRAQEGTGVGYKELMAWKAAQKKVCHWCGAKCKSDFHVDHYVPLSKGGTHTTDNMVIACPKCNLTKNAKDPYQFAGLFGRLF